MNYGIKGCSKYVTGVTGLAGLTGGEGEEEGGEFLADKLTDGHWTGLPKVVQGVLAALKLILFFL